MGLGGMETGHNLTTSSLALEMIGGMSMLGRLMASRLRFVGRMDIGCRGDFDQKEIQELSRSSKL